MRFVRLHIINDAFAYANDSTACKTVSGADLFGLVQSIYPKGLPLNTYLYHNKLDTDCDITPKSEQDIDRINTLDGEFYLVTYPADPVTLITIAVSVAVSVAVAFLMPKPEIPSGSSSQPPSPNNALASRGNRQRLGGRVPDIFGEVWAYPDLIAPTYSVYIDHKEVEYAYMALGMGEYQIKKAHDDTTPIGYINGATVSVFNPNQSFLDAPEVRFGAHLSADENQFNALFAKRYTAVNGQVLPPPNNYIMLDDTATFVPPNLITITGKDLSKFKSGDALLIESAGELASTKGIVEIPSGRNLLINTQAPSNDKPISMAGAEAGLGNVQMTNDDRVMQIQTGTSTNSYWFSKLNTATRYLETGKPYVLSGWVKASVATELHSRWASHNGTVWRTQAIAYQVGTEWAYFELKFAGFAESVNATRVALFANAPVGVFEFKELKLEEGTSATHYTPAPEDGIPIDVRTSSITPYNLGGSYTIEAVNADGIALVQPERVASDWERLTANADTAKGAGAVISSEEKPIWEGWFYTDLPEHDDVLINIKAPNGLYTSYGDEWVVNWVNIEIQSEIVNDNGQAVTGTLHRTHQVLRSPKYDKYVRTEDVYRDIGILGRRIVNRQGEQIRTNDDDVRRTAAVSAYIANPHFSRGKKMRWRIRRSSSLITSNKGQVVQEVRVADCYGVRHMTADDTPPNVTLVATKTLATEGALSLKERKLKLLVQRKLRDYRSGDALMLSNRIDDIIYNIATDRLLGGMSRDDINMAQISAEIDKQIAYFSTDKCAQFCGTFDNTDVTAEEMIQTVAQAGFCQAYRLNNQIHLHFERRQDYAVVQFNSHNILPDSYSYSESFGARNNHDGVQVTYIDPIDDAKVTLDYPPDKSAQKPQKLDLLGVRNKVQAHMHLMRTHHKNQLAYKSCEFTGADESGIVIPTNRIDVASQFNADVMQGVVERLDTVGGQIIATVSEPVDISSGTLFVQTVAGVVDNIKVTKADNPYQLILSRAPSQPLSLSYDAVVRATFKLVSHTELDRDAYIVSSKDRGDNPLSHKLTCINYTDKYYQNDDDFRRGLIA